MWTLVTILALLLGVVLLKLYMSWYDTKRDEAERQYWTARELLHKWQRARPFLQIGACEYSRMLVYEMIDAYSILLALGVSRDREHLQSLHELLNQDPSPYNPCVQDSAFAESFLNQ